MMKTLLLLTVSLAVLIGACTPAAQGPVLSATINRDCGPADGPAFTVTIPVDAGGRIVATIWQAPEIAGRASFSLTDPTDATGSASLVTASEALEPLSGTISFDAVKVDRPVRGSFRLLSASGEAFEGSFTAEWLQFPAYCG